MRAAAAVVAAMLALASPLAAQPAEPSQPPEDAADPNGDERIAAAVVLFDAGDYAAAAIIFATVYAKTERPDALFGWAQALRLSGDCPTALPLYRRYLADANPEPHQIEATNKAIALCPESTEITEPPQPEEPDATPDETPDPTPIETETGTAAATRDTTATTDWVSVGLAAGAVTGVALGATFYGLARSASSDADDAPTYDEYAVAADRAESRQRVAWVAAGVGVTAAASLVLWRWLRPRGGEAPIAVAPRSDGVTAVLRLSF